MSRDRRCLLPGDPRFSSCSSGSTRAVHACSSYAGGARRASSTPRPRFLPANPSVRPSTLRLHSVHAPCGSYALMLLVGVTAGFANVHARFVGPLPPDLRDKCASNFEGELHGHQAAAIQAACASNVADRVCTAAEYMVVTLSLLSFAVYANSFAGAERRAQRSDAVPRKQALALFMGTDLAGLPWAVLSPACFMATYWSLVPLEVRCLLFQGLHRDGPKHTPYCR